MFKRKGKITNNIFIMCLKIRVLTVMEFKFVYLVLFKKINLVFNFFFQKNRAFIFIQNLSWSFNFDLQQDVIEFLIKHKKMKLVFEFLS